MSDGTFCRDGNYYDRDGNIITAAEWREHMASRDYVVIGQEEKYGMVVSTVWVGRDVTTWTDPAAPTSNRHGDGPQIFHTAVFRDFRASGIARSIADAFSGLEEFVHTYATEEEARANHRAIVAQLHSDTVGQA